MVGYQTLCHVIDSDRILLKKANRGVSIGKWNAPGGKIEGDETPEQNAIREVDEETGLLVKNLFYHGLINFHLGGKEETSSGVHLFSTKEFEGAIKPSDEGEVKWFPISRLPINEMWDDDNYWLDLMWKGRKFDADFYLNKDNTKVTRYSVRIN